MKTIQQLPNLSDIKSVRSIGATSIPKIKRPAHLELYVLGMEKSRMEKELFALDKRRDSVKKQLDSVNDRLEKLQKEIWEKRGAKTGKTPKNTLKTMVLNY